jgi:hypothetical protein
VVESNEPQQIHYENVLCRSTAEWLWIRYQKNNKLMRNKNNITQTIKGAFGLLLTFLAVSVGSTPLASAAQTGTGGGTIYFSEYGQLYSMNSDGSGRTALPANVNGEPCRVMHGGHRWFLQGRQIPGQFYPSGTMRSEWFAVRDDGNEAFTKQLTDRPDLESVGNSRWALDATLNAVDGLVSFIARRWDIASGTAVEGGIYATDIVFDGNGNVVGLAAQPAAPLVPLALVNKSNGSSPDIGSHDWSPSGTEIVFDRYSVKQLRIANLIGATRLVMADWSSVPVWSPAGTTIAFNAYGGIDTISPTGANRKNILKGAGYYGVGFPQWSPTGSHIAYHRYNLSTHQTELYRATSIGGSKTPLTSVSFNINVAGWR